MNPPAVGVSQVPKGPCPTSCKPPDTHRPQTKQKMLHFSGARQRPVHFTALAHFNPISGWKSRGYPSSLLHLLVLGNGVCHGSPWEGEDGGVLESSGSGSSVPWTSPDYSTGSPAPPCLRRKGLATGPSSSRYSRRLSDAWQSRRGRRRRATGPISNTDVHCPEPSATLCGVCQGCAPLGNWPTGPSPSSFLQHHTGKSDHAPNSIS